MEEKKVIYITGGSKGIGKGMARYLLGKGYRIAISSRTLSASEAALAEIAKDGKETEVLALQSDVRNLKAEEKAISQILSKWGRLDILIANAGLGIFGPIDQLSPSQWQQVIDTNVTGVFNSVKASVESLKKSKGYIFTIASLAGTNFFPNGSAYIASKYAIVGFSQSIMLDMRPYGVKVSTIMPGSVTSHFNNHTPSLEEDAWKIQPEDLGEIIYNLLQMHPRVLPSKVEVRPSNPPVRPNSAPQ